MAWKLYALGSGGVFLATYLVSSTPPRVEPRLETSFPLPQAVGRTGGTVDLGEQADRLRARLADRAPYRQPGRDAFRFGATRRPALDEPTSHSIEAPAPAVTSPSRLPFSLAGVASTIEGGITSQTAILSSLQGVLMVKEGDVVDGGYRVLAVEEESVTVEATSDGARTTLRLPR